MPMPRWPSLLDAKPRHTLRDFLRLAEPETSRLGVADLASEAISGAASLRSAGHPAPPGIAEMEARWYASLAAGTPDWTVYDDDAYLAELWRCWLVYSRSYLRNMRQQNLIPADGQTVADLGCGFGFTTAVWAQLTRGRVTGTNLPGTAQMRMAQTVAGAYGFRMAGQLSEVGPVDVVFASEYFEHIQAPLDHLADVLATLQPRVLWAANAFTARSTGHFPRYLVNGHPADGRKIARLFAGALQRAGYVPVKTRLWNTRPGCWQRPG
jgi:SAM-dependent methyltransferase